MVRFSLSALAVIASATLIGAIPVPQAPSVDAHPDLHLPANPNGPGGEIKPQPVAAPAPEAPAPEGPSPAAEVPAPEGPSPAAEIPAPEGPSPGPEAPRFEAPALDPEHQDGTGTGADAPDANPFSAGSGEGDKSTADTYVDALTSP
ncbi:hypothetical protein ACHAPJ_011640 [Fusarium lateritium]